MRSEPIIKLNEKCDLYLEVVIEEFEYVPILFVAKDKEKNLYLCLCSDFRSVHRWIISSTDLSILSKLIECEITINDALEQHGDDKYIVEYIPDRGFSSKRVSFDLINPLYLTEPGVYAEYAEEEAKDYVVLAIECKLKLYGNEKRADKVTIPLGSSTDVVGDLTKLSFATTIKYTSYTHTTTGKAHIFCNKNIGWSYIPGFSQGYGNSGGSMDLKAAS